MCESNRWINKQKHKWTAQECIKQWEETNTVFERALVDMHKVSSCFSKLHEGMAYKTSTDASHLDRISAIPYKSTYDHADTENL